ncbi:MAG TPA: porin [Polyangia bacterium]|nr:porin [Polyangia bacterium]
MRWGRLFAKGIALLAMSGRVGAASAEEAAAPAAVPEAPRPDGAATPGPGPQDPLAGLAGEHAFLRSPSNEIVLFPGFLLQVGGAFYPRQLDDLRSGFTLRRARLELAGWLGPMFYFDVAGDFTAADGPPASGGRPPSDAYLAFAPEGDLFIVQAGQFDAPFSLENRTLDAYLPFVDRSLVVRTLAAPYNKDLGVMVHGTDDARLVYYSGGVFNGDGPALRNGDNRVDVIGRVSVSPLARTSLDAFHEVSLGASAWYGQRAAGQAFPTQATPGGFAFFVPSWTMGQMPPLTFDLLESGSTLTLGGELNAPIGHQAGVRGEGVLKEQDLAEAVIATDGSPPTTRGRAHLRGFGGYGEAWLWLVGDDRLLPRPGFELPKRLRRVVEPPAEHGLMVTARGELLQEDLTSTSTNANPNTATTRLVTATLGVNYWYGRRVRATLNYALTFLSGTTENVKNLQATSKTEQEVLLLLAMGL